MKSLFGLLAMFFLADPSRPDPRLDEAKRTAAEVDRLFAAGEYARALAPAERARALYEAVLGPNAPEVATACQDLANVQLSLGALDRAAVAARQALAIRERLGERKGIARALGYLAPVYYSMGAYDRAEPLWRRALEIFEAEQGPQSPEAITVLSNLAAVYKVMGDYDRAEPLLRRALAAREAEGAPRDLAIALNNLAEIHESQGRNELATPLLVRSLALREQAFGPDHPAVATGLINLGANYKSRGEFARAEPLFRRALALDEKAYGPVHPHVALSANALASLYSADGAFAKAEPLFRRSLAITEKVLPPHHSQIAHALGNLATFLAGQHQIAEAVALFRRELDLSEHMLRSARAVSTESRMAAFLESLHTEEQVIYNLLRQHPADPELRRLALAVALLRKGRSVDEAADTSRAALVGLGPPDRELFGRLQKLRARLASLELASLERIAGGSDPARVTKLEEEAEKLEQELAQRSAPLRALRQQPGPGEVIERVARALPADGALVEVVAYRTYRFGGGLPARRWGALRYLLLTLSPEGAIGVADLGTKETIDAAVGRLLAALTRPDTDPVRPARELDRLVMAKVRPLVGARRRLWLSLDGELQLVPFAALHDGQGYLVDRYELGYLSSGRDLLRPESAESARRGPTEAVLLVDPAFGAPPALAAAQLGGSRRERGLLPASIPPLPGTRAEAEAIRKLVPTARVLSGAEATEPALLGLVAPDILHVATHGVFLADPAAPAGGARGLHLVSTAVGAPAAKNPLVRSALLLAGAGAPALRASEAPDGPDGVATALEVAGMNLWGTELVVLSACDSGRGAVRLGQGVYGLRRAVLVAGAETLVTSLWRVDDEVTEKLMTRFYEGLLSGRGRLESMGLAARAIRLGHPHPYYWAPFVVMGRTDPLRPAR